MRFAVAWCRETHKIWLLYKSTFYSLCSFPFPRLLLNTSTKGSSASIFFFKKRFFTSQKIGPAKFDCLCDVQWFSQCHFLVSKYWLDFVESGSTKSMTNWNLVELTSVEPGMSARCVQIYLWAWPIVRSDDEWPSYSEANNIIHHPSYLVPTQADSV